MEVLTRSEYERLRFVSKGLLGRLTDDEIRRCGDRYLAALAANRQRALLSDDDDKIVETGDALMATLPRKVLYRRKVPQRIPHR